MRIIRISKVSSRSCVVNIVDLPLRKKGIEYLRLAQESTFQKAKRQKKETDEQGSLLDE